MFFKKLVGLDYLGNKYYVSGSCCKVCWGSCGSSDKKNKKARETRTVKYSTKDFTAIPPEWDAWLRHTVSALPTNVLVSDVYCGNASGSPYAQYPQGDVIKKNRKIYSNYRRWIPQ